MPRVIAKLSPEDLDKARTVAADLEDQLEPLDMVRVRERIFQERQSATERIRFLQSPIAGSSDDFEHGHRA